ncbi:MAG: TonB-dependent receptor [Bacteroidales bacterium]
MMKLSPFMIMIMTYSLICSSLAAQPYEIRGRITDAKTGEPMTGAYVVIKNEVYGTMAGKNGSFVLRISQPLPVVLHISFVGYVPLDVEVKNPASVLDIKMEEQLLLGQEVVISASRIEENILRSPVSIEKMNIQDLKQISTSSFYDGLYQLKGVDMTVNGLTFQVPNARGFNDYTNYRMTQIIDGVENIAPGLGFFAGNIFGLQEIDISSLELVTGASTALYGPGGMNGTLVMTSKDPFKYQGLSVLIQPGMMNFSNPATNRATPMYELDFRYARAFSNRTALKITGAFLNATDWPAADRRDRSNLDNPALNRISDPGYDGVNIYGDESLVSVNLQDVASQVIGQIAESQGILPGTRQYDDLYNQTIPYFPDQLVTRTGWLERDLFHDKTRNLSLGGSFHYFINKRTEAIVQGNYAEGTSVFTAQNRFAARNFSILSGKVEVNNPDYYFRVWGVEDNSGSSFDIGGAALLLNESWKPSETWFSDYLTAYTQTALLTGDMTGSHVFARLVADNRDPLTGVIFDQSKPAIPVAGTAELKSLMDQITSKPLNAGGAQVYDNSKIYQAEGMYNFNKLIKFMEMQAGISERIYVVDSKGTVFADEPGNPIIINQLGGFLQINKNLFNNSLRITGAFRYDKNQYFKSQYTPRFSLIQFLDRNKEHSIRGTIQTAYRFPSISDQWVDVNTGLFRSIGGMPRVQDKYHFNTIPLYPMSGRNPVTDKPVTENGPIVLPGLKPEKVAAFELGYRGLFLKKKLYLDAYSYYNRYHGFEAVQLLAQLAKDAGTAKDLLFETFFSTRTPVSTFGWAIGLDYRTPDGILIRTNVAFDKLLKGIYEPGVEAAFNTPPYRANLSVSHNSILPNLGFSFNIHWQEKFLWQSDFGNGEIPAHTTLDTHFSYKLQSLHTELRMGGSNIFNRYYTTSFGSAEIGGLFYITILYEDLTVNSERGK